MEEYYVYYEVYYIIVTLYTCHELIAAKILYVARLEQNSWRVIDEKRA